MPASTPKSGQKPPAHKPATAALIAPWLRNRVRRRWTRIIFGLFCLLDGVLLFVNLDAGPAGLAAQALRWGVLLGGVLTPALVYVLARTLGASRGAGLWAMALLGVNVPWLLYLRTGDPRAFFTLAAVLAVLGYVRICTDARGGWLLLGLGAPALFLCCPAVGAGLLLALITHAAWWVRRPAHARQLLWAGGLLLAGVVAARWYGKLPLAFALPDGAAVAAHLLSLFAWLLPLLALPLAALALVQMAGGRWHLHRAAALFALLVIVAVATASFCPGDACLRHLIILAPFTALWLALGIDRLRAHTTPWLWLPIGLLLVLTTLPQSLLSWTARATRLPARAADPRLARALAEPGPDALVPLYTYLVHDSDPPFGIDAPR